MNSLTFNFVVFLMFSQTKIRLCLKKKLRQDIACILCARNTLIKGVRYQRMEQDWY